MTDRDITNKQPLSETGDLLCISVYPICILETLKRVIGKQCRPSLQKF